jgi:UDP-N-acetylmuramyl pentapeptide phosphotransferase/UDP-N-acetylglucosamine-1-phosphate transferase
MLFVLAFVSSALACYLIIRSAALHLHFTGDRPGFEPQKFHTQSTPRVGGLALLAGVVVAGLELPLPRIDIALYWTLMLALLPAFLGGFVEDVTHRVGAGARLLLTVITAAFAYSLAGVHFENSDMVWLNTALAFAPFGYAALLFAVAGVAHAMNLIDGYNGLASGFALITLAAMGYVANGAGDALVTTLCYATVAATLGFFFFNYPRGRIFLGDGGAYLLGCIIALAGAMLILRNPRVSPWFPLALVIYPVWETLFSVMRRAFLYGTEIGQPDARHLHSLVYRRLSRRWIRGRRAEDKAWRNSLTTLPFWLVCGLLATLAVMGAYHTRVQQLLAVVFVAGYCLAYWRLARAGAVRRREAPQGKTARRPGQAGAEVK